MTARTRRPAVPSRSGVVAVVVAGLLAAACSTASDGTGGGASSTDAPAPAATEPAVDLAADADLVADDGDNIVVVRSGSGLSADWSDYGWSATITDTDVAIDLGSFGGWIAANLALTGNYTALQISISPASDSGDLGNDFLQVSLADSIGSDFPVLVPNFQEDAGRRVATVDMDDLLAGMGGFDRIVLTANKEFPTPTSVVLNELVLVPGAPSTSTVGAATDTVDASAIVNCAAPTAPISPQIYGVARPLSSDPSQWEIGATGRRWGGNPTSRYNWRLGAWNTAFDYYFQNVNVSGDRPAHEEFLIENWENGVGSAVTVSMLDWVAKDTSSASFPISVFGQQEYFDPEQPDFGNGRTPGGDDITPRAPTNTSVSNTPADVAAWIESMNDLAAFTDNPRPFMYILDNEPMLWSSTHRDIVTDPLGYDELLERSIATATAVKSADPDALVAGPAVWGWPAYFFSAVDAVGGFSDTPDFRAHGNVGLLEWYLQQMADHEERTGQRLLDVLDVHFYPQDGSYGTDVDERAAARRLRTTRSLWDANYGEESWIEDTVELIPRMQRWVDTHYPDTLLSIGEYSFGAEGHISGGLAQAEALGRFGQNGLYSAFYWVTPPQDSPVYWAFRAFRNYDGNGAAFGDLSIPTTSSRPISVFASTFSDESQDHDVLIVVNLSPDEETTTDIELASCDRTTATALRYTGDAQGFEPADATIDGDILEVTLPPYSISVIELR